MRKNPEAGERIVTLISALLMVGITGIIWRAGTIAFIPVYWISKSAIIGALSTLLIGALFFYLPRKQEFAILIRRYRFTLALLITPFIGLMGSTIAGFGWGAYFPLVRFEYVRLLFIFTLFFTTAYVAFVRPRAIQHIFALIVVSCVPLWFALVPSLTKLFPVEVGRLTGTGNDSNFLAIWVAIALIIAVIFFLWEERTTRWLWLTAIFFITPLLVWTISRAAWLTMAIAVVAVLIIFFKEGCALKRRSRLGILIATVATSLVCGFLLFPPLSRAVISIRVLGHFINHEQLAHVVQLVAPGKNIDSGEPLIINNRLGLTGELLTVIDNDRGWLWKEGAKRLAQAPLGFGLSYYFWNPIGIEGLWIKHKLNAHNLWLDVGLSNGWLGLAVWILFMFLVTRHALRMDYNNNPQSLALAVSFFMLLFLGSFMDLLTQPILWIIIALIVVSPTTTRE